MTDGDMKKEPESRVGEPGSPPVIAGPGAPAGTTAPMFDIQALPLQCLRILKDPAGSLEALYKPGKPALIQGLAIGGSVAILIPLIQLLFGKLSMGEYFRPQAGQILKQCLGGVVFLAAGAALSFLLKKTLGKAASGDWQDDVYLFGSSMLFLLAAVIVGGLLALINEKFFSLLAHIVLSLGLLLTAFTYYWGLLKVTKADAGRGICVVAAALAGALLIGGLLDFSPLMTVLPMTFDPAGAQREAMREMENILKGFNR